MKTLRWEEINERSIDVPDKVYRKFKDNPMGAVAYVWSTDASPECMLIEDRDASWDEDSE